MGTFFKAVKKGFEAAKGSLGPGRYSLKGKDVTCPHCARDLFREGRAMLNTRGRTLIDADWADRTATTLVCHNCGYIQWFAQEPERKEP